MVSMGWVMSGYEAFSPPVHWKIQRDEKTGKSVFFDPIAGEVVKWAGVGGLAVGTRIDKTPETELTAAWKVCWRKDEP